MDKILSSLTHDNQEFEKQWPDTFQKIQRSTQQNAQEINQTVSAFAGYIRAEKQSSTKSYGKEAMINGLTKRLHEQMHDTGIKMDDILETLLDVFISVLSDDNTSLLNLLFLKAIYSNFRLGEYLSEHQPHSAKHVKRIITCLKNNTFKFNVNNNVNNYDGWRDFLCRYLFSQLSSDKNKLDENTMQESRNEFQQLCRTALENAKSERHDIWYDLARTIITCFPTLFDSYDPLTASKIDLTLSVQLASNSNELKHLLRDYVRIFVKSYEKNPDLFKENYDQILSAIHDLILSDFTIETVELARIFSNLVIHYFSPSDFVPIESLVKMLNNVCQKVVEKNPDQQWKDNLCSDIIKNFIYKLKDVKLKKLSLQYFDLIISIVKLHTLQAPECGYRILSKEEFYPWKDLVSNKIPELIQACVSYDTFDVKNLTWNVCTALDSLEDILSLLEKRGQAQPVLFKYSHPIALTYIQKWSSQEPNELPDHVCKMGTPLMDLIDPSQIDISVLITSVDLLIKRVADDESDIKGHLFGYYMHYVKNIGDYLSKQKSIPTLLHEKLSQFCRLALDQSLMTETGCMTFPYGGLTNIWVKIPLLVETEENAKLYVECTDVMRERSEDTKDLYLMWYFFWSLIATKYLDLASTRIEQFLNDFINDKQMTMQTILNSLYTRCPDSYHSRVSTIISEMFVNNGQYVSSFNSILGLITREHPEIITGENIDQLFNEIKKRSIKEVENLYTSLTSIASTQPDLFSKHQDYLLTISKEQTNTEVFRCLNGYLLAHAIQDENKADESVKIFTDLLEQKTTTNDMRKLIFHQLQLIGMRYKNIIKPYRQLLIKYEKENTCRILIDLIDGKSLEEYSDTIKNATQEIAEYEKRIKKTEKDMIHVKNVVKKQELKVTNLNEKVNVVDTKLTDVTGRVNVHEQEIERIDKKTLSHVPTWGRNVTKLLNSKTDNDWRLLGKRLGYSSSELKHWATQSDPCMALLNEWYITHKSDEATYGLVKILKDIGRTDAEKIIRNATKEAGESIPDDMNIDIKRLPPVFISYQWTHQKEVSLLKSHLEMAGYECWMDVGQMGGGDKLFKKIDTGIRGAKVVLCCVNKQYAQSDNCCREVNLSVTIDKPIIPLQMEKQTWPPEGSLGPIMSEYVFIRFFNRDNKQTNSDVYWPNDKFNELLGQIRYYVAPNPDMINERYKNWFVPKVDNLIFLQPTNSQTTKPLPKSEKEKNKEPKIDLNDVPIVISHPQIMISYQWGRQKDILDLYKKLTVVGYRCWLDIFQMGGGDSLYEKIDQGIRNAKVILSCITPKYIISANCRREMSLSDALKKPIIPLLLDSTPWPPPGPMSLVFTEKRYINFCPSNDDMIHWSGKNFEQLLMKLEQNIPEIMIEKPVNLINMKRPISASVKNVITTTEQQNQDNTTVARTKRIGSAPIIQKSRACCLM
ncbi:unnamed protein product [Didymodactylos carnosus]|uniref:Death domain-containing protein n=1 Tax=Didymodactylos carnosus TaxID=1234261 RepID=A0A8S2CWU9_9BILA|nr:unnamed protein product [Didymodactylos carnosus]CAF3567926.1 unnamed protein product [Didymodactylos carnosus]